MCEITEEDFALIDADNRRTKEAFRAGYKKGKKDGVMLSEEEKNFLIDCILMAAKESFYDINPNIEDAYKYGEDLMIKLGAAVPQEKIKIAGV